MLTLLVAHVALTASVPIASNPVVLRYKFHRGQSHVYKMATDSNMTMGMGGPSQSIASTINATTRMTVKSIAPNGTATIDSLVLDSKATGPMASMMPNLKGKSSTLKMSPTGQTSGLDTSGASSGPMGMNLSSLEMGSTLPSGAVSVGAHWTSAGSLGSGSMPFHNTLLAIRSVSGHTIAVIEVRGDVDLSKMNSMLSSLGAGSKMSGIVHFDGKTLFDNTTGIMRSVDVTAKFTMHMSLNMNGKAMELTPKGTQRITMNLAG